MKKIDRTKNKVRYLLVEIVFWILNGANLIDAQAMYSIRSINLFLHFCVTFF